MKLPLTFTGDREALADILDHEGVTGDWSSEPNGVQRLRLKNGAGLHWSTTTGALWCDGPSKAASRLEGQVVMALHWLAFRDTDGPVEGAERPRSQYAHLRAAARGEAITDS